MNIKKKYTKTALLVLSLGLFTAMQSCTKKSVLDDASEDTHLFGTWKRVIRRLPLGDSVQTLTFYEGTLATFKTDVYATSANNTPNTTQYRATYNTNGSQLYLQLNLKQNSTDPNSDGTAINQVLLDKAPYKISGNLDTLTITSNGTLKYIKINQ